MAETGQCTHLDAIRPVTPRTPEGCGECLRTGSSWVHLRLCLSCGEVACCNDSPNRHAQQHFHATGHPIARSFEPGESWGWCWVDEVFLRPRLMAELWQGPEQQVWHH